MTTFCVTSMSQEVCRPPLVSFDVNRKQLKDGWLHTTGASVHETRHTEVNYYDNRLIADTLFSSQGQVTLTNISKTSRRIKYRHSVPIQRGTYSISQDSTDYEVCADDGKVIFYYESASLQIGVPHVQEWTYSIDIQPYGDLNGDQCINARDIGLLLGDWGIAESNADFNADGTVDPADLGILLANWKDYDCIESPESGPYNPVWESADDILAFTIDSWGDGVITIENITVENLKGDAIGIVDDDGNGRVQCCHVISGYQVIGLSGWSPVDTWVIEAYTGDLLVGRTSSDSDGPVYNPDGGDNYGNSIYWKPQIEVFNIGDRWILYRWYDSPETFAYPPVRVN